MQTTNDPTIPRLLHSRREELKSELAALETQMKPLELRIRPLERHWRHLHDGIFALEGQVKSWERHRTFDLFFELPAELRNLIWTQYFAERRPRDSIQIAMKDYALNVSKQVRKETMKFILENKSLRLYFEAVRYGDNSKRRAHIEGITQRLLASISKETLAHIQYIELFCFTDDRWHPIKSCWTVDIIKGEVTKGYRTC